MKPGSYASYRAAMPPECFGEPDDEPPPTPRDIANAPPAAVVVHWLEPVSYSEEMDVADVFGNRTRRTVIINDRARTFRVFGSEPWRWQHVKAWADAMERRYGKGNVWIEEEF